MRILAILALLSVAGLASATPPTRQQQLMDEVERSVVLPKGAQPLNAYGRNYAFSGKGKVVATYLIPFPPFDMSDGCDVMLKNFDSRPCTKKEIAESVRSNARGVAAQTPAGSRRWYRSPNSLPFINDGGCLQISVEYDIAAHHIVRVSCNGYA